MTIYRPPVVPYLGPPSRQSKGNNKPIRRIVLHGTVSAPTHGGARSTAAYFRSNNARGSAHYIIDPSAIVQSAYDSVIAWHAPPNSHSIGIEFCDWVGGKNGKPLPRDRWFDENHLPMLRLGARLVAELCLCYGVPVKVVGPAGMKAGRRGICEHSDVSMAYKQSSHWDLGEFPRYRFRDQVAREVYAINHGSMTGQPITLKTVLPWGKSKPKLRDKVQAAPRAARMRLSSAVDPRTAPKPEVPDDLEAS